MLESSPEGGAGGFKLHGQVGTRYRLESCTNLAYPVAWQAAADITLTNSVSEIRGIETHLPALFLRARELP